MHADELAFVRVLASTAEASIYALERELAHTRNRRRRRALEATLAGVRADLMRCELVLG